MYKCFIRVLIVLSAWSTFPVFAQDEVSVLYAYGKNSFDKVLAGFTEKTNIKLKSEFKEQNDLKSNIMTMMELGTTPDVIIMPADHLGLHNFINYSELDRSLFPAKISDRIWAGSYSDGKLYGAPLVQGNHLMLFYNKSLVKEPAVDWDAMFVQKQELDAKNIATIAWSFDEVYWFLPFLVGQGGWPLNNGKIELNTPAMAAALDFYKSLRTRQLPHPSCSYQCGVDMFKSGKVAYTLNGDWIGKEFSEALGDNLGVAHIPMIEGKKILPTFATYVMAFPRDSLNGAKRAKLIQFVNYLQSPAVQQQLWELGGSIPVEDTAFAYAEKNSQGYLKQELGLMNDTKPLPADKEITFMWDAIGKGFLRHREGALDAHSAAKYMQQLAERHVRNAQRQEQQAEKANGIANQ